MDKIELRKLQAFLRHSFGNEDIRVVLDPKNIEAAAVISVSARLALSQSMTKTATVHSPLK